MQDARPPILSATGVTKAFGATRALRGVNIALHPGEIHALLGENGAGKSTLVKILAGAAQPDSGRLRLRGERIRLGSVRQATGLGIVPIYQHLSLMPHLSVLDNLFAFGWASGPMWRGRPAELSAARAREMLARVGLTAEPEAAVGSLSLAERQLVEIARGVGRDCAVLILDEPTAALNQSEAERLFAAARELCANGKAVLLISHNLDEIEAVADRITILRDGLSVVEGAPRARLSRQEVVEQMIGRALAHEDDGTRPRTGEPVLRAEGLCVPGALRDADLTLHKGEILGVVGLIGSGALELGRAIAGLARPSAGRLLCGGREIAQGDRAAALAAGIGLVPGERETEGIFAGRSVLENASAAGFGEFAAGGWLRRSAERRRYEPWLRALRVVPENVDAPIDSLSGGNQQKVLLARNLALERLRALVAIEPTRGVDVGARETIHRALAEAARGGTGILIVSSDLEEVTAICHRVLVVRGGIAAELPGDSGSAAILSHLTGAAA